MNSLSRPWRSRYDPKIMSGVAAYHPPGAVLNQNQRTSFDADFWRDFVADFWERDDTLSACPFSLSEADVFAAMVAAAESERRNEACNFNDPYRIAVDGAHVLDPDTYQALLPLPEDGDLDGFIARLESICDYDLGFQLTKVTSWSPRLWRQFRDFLSPFFEAAGLIPEVIEVDIFFGRYGQTHFGVHRDSDSIFTIGLRGEKLFRLWPADFFPAEATIEGWPNHIQDDYYQRHAGDASVVTVGPGDMAYWPSAVWHVGETPEDWSLTIAVALHLNPDPYERVKAVISNVLPAPMRAVDANAYPMDPRGFAKAAPPLAANLAEALAAIRSTMAGDVVDLHLCLDWLKQVSGCGLTATPPADEVNDLADDTVLRIEPGHPILWRCFPGARVVVAANGYGDLFEGFDPVAVLGELNGGTAVTVGDLLARGSNEGTTRDGLRLLLCRLASWRVFVGA